MKAFARINGAEQGMQILVKLEDLAQVLFSIYLFSRLTFPWWVFPLFIFAPDLSMLGYLAGKPIGAAVYNLVHHKAVAVAAYVAGAMLSLPTLSLVGVVLFGHSSFDRMLGFGFQPAGSLGQKIPEPVGGQEGVHP